MKRNYMNSVLGVFLHSIGGFSAGSFYIPFKKVRDWAWESYWLVCNIAAFGITPFVVAFLTIPDPIAVLRTAPVGNIFACYLFGVLWGIGGLTLGLSLRYLGVSLGMALSLGYCAVFGTIIPPIYFGTFGDLVSTLSGLTTLGGVAVCISGIALCGWAGMSKERELSDEQKLEVIKEFNFKKGFFVALFCGIMSACFAFGMAAGKPIADHTVTFGAPSQFKNNLVLCLIHSGGLTTNFISCTFLNIKNKTSKNYYKRANINLLNNYFFSVLAGIIAYGEFLFYGMGTTKMGKYDFSSWTIHMAFVILFANLWGLFFNEWKGSSRRTLSIVFSGLLMLFASTVVIGIGNYLVSLGK